jgi:hypothetical protein
MKLRFLLFTCIFALLVGCAMGKNALNKMTPEERTFAEKLHQIERGISKEEVITILGENYRTRGRSLIWHPTGDGANQARVHFMDGKVYDIQWMKIGSFAYEPLDDR